MAEQTTSALQKYSTLVRLNPDDPEAHLGLAMAYEEVGQHNYAYKEYQEVLRLDPRNARAHLHMGFAYCRSAETLPAIKEWQKAHELDPKVGKLLEDPKTKPVYDKKIEAALGVFERPILMRPDDSYGHYQLAMAYRYFNKKEMALNELKKTVELNPNLWEAYNASGEIYAELNQLQFAKIQYQKAVSVNPRSPNTFYNLGTIFEDEGMVGIAIQKFERALEIEPNNPKLLFALGRAYLKQGRFKKAIVQFQKSIDKDPQNPQAHYLLAKACEAIYRPDFAIREYELAINIDPRHGDAHYNLGTIYINTGNLKKGIEHLERSLKLNPGDALAYYNLGSAYDKMGQFEKAIDNYAHSLSLNPRDAFARYNLGQIFFKMGRFEEAIQEFERALEINPSDASFYLNLGKAYLELEDYDGAVEMFQRSVEHKPNDFEGHYSLARAFMTMERYDMAIVELNRVTDLDPSAPQPHYDLAQCLYTMGDIDQAFEQYQKVLIYESKNLGAIQGVGHIYLYYRNKPDIAIDFFDQALEVDENFLPAIIEKGNAYFRMRKMKAARNQFEKAASINPDDVNLLHGLAQVYSEIGDFEAAEKEMQKVVNLDPEHPANRAFYAKILARNEKITTAVEQYKKAIVLDPGNLDLYVELTDQLLRLGDLHGAKSTLTVLLDRSPEFEMAQRALEVLFESPGRVTREDTVRSLSGIPEEGEAVAPEEAAIPEPVSPMEEAVPFSQADAVSDAPQSIPQSPVSSMSSLRPKIQKKGLQAVLKSDGAQKEDAPSAPMIMPKTLNIFTRAITAQAKGDEKEAADLFQEVILNAPQYYQAYSYLGELLSKMGRTGESIDILTKGRNLAEKFNDKEYVDIFAKHLGFVSSVLKTAAPATEGPQEAPPPAGLKPEDFFLFDVSSGVEGESERADDAPTVEQTPSPSGKAAPWDAPAPVDPQEASVPVGVRDKGLPSWVVFDQETPSPGGAEAASTISAYTAAPLSVMGFQSSQINADAMGEVAPKKGEAPAPAPVAPMDDMAGWFLEGDKAVEDALAQPDLQAVDEEIPPPEEPSPVQLPFPGGISMKSLEPAPAEDDLEGPPSLESEMEASLAMEMPFDEADLEFADQDLESLIGPEDEVDFLSVVPDAPPWDAMDSALESKVSMIERFLSLHKVKQAELELSKLEETAPHHPRVIRLKAELAREKGEWDEFVALWDAYMDAGAPRTGENVLTLVDGLEKAGQIERAISLCQDLLDQDASNIDVAILFADLLVKGGKGKDAVSQLQKLIRLKPSVPRFILSLARTYREMGKFSLATVQYQKLLKLAETPEVFNELGSNLEMSGEIDAAIECYAKAAEIASENLLANVSAILLYKQKLELKNAASFCHRLLESEDLPEDITQAIHKELDTLGRAGKKSGGEAASLLDTDEEREITALLLEFREVLQEEETAATMDLVLTQEEEREPEYQPEPDTGKTPAKPAPKAAKAGSKSKSAKGGSKSKTAAKSKSTATKNKK